VGLSGGLLRTAELKLSSFTFLAPIVSAVVWIIPFGKGVVIPESPSPLSTLTSSTVLSFKMLKEAAYSNN